MHIPPTTPARHRRGLPGSLLGGETSRRQILTLIDTVGATVQADSITVGGAEDDEDYVLRFAASSPGLDGFTVDITASTGSSANAAALVAAIVAAADAQPTLWQLLASVTAASGAVAVAWRSGVTGTIEILEDPGSHLAIVSVSTPLTPAYLYGRAVEVVGWGGYSQEVSNGGMRPLVAGAGPVLELDVDTNADSQTFDLTILHTPLGGTPRQIDVTAASAATDLLTAASIRTALTTALAGTGAVVDNAGKIVEIALPIGDSVAILSIASSGSLDVLPDLEAGDDPPAHLGIVIRDQQTQAREADEELYPSGPRGGSASVAVAGCLVGAELASGVAAQGPVYIETAAGADRGRPYPSPSPTRVRYLRAHYRGASTGLAELEIA